MVTYFVVAGEERKEIPAGQTVDQVLSDMGMERGEGEIILIADREVKGSDIVPEGSSLVYVPPVDLGF